MGLSLLHALAQYGKKFGLLVWQALSLLVLTPLVIFIFTGSRQRQARD